MSVRIGILSLAHLHAESYVRLLHGWDGVELLVADLDGAGAEQALRDTRSRIERLGVVVLDSADELFDARPDGVVICTPNAQHVDLTLRAAAAGVHVLSEKPLATTRADALTMIEGCERAGVGLMTAYPTRFSPAIRELDTAIRRGDIGRVLASDGANIGRLPGGDRRWFGDEELAGGGALADHTVHLADVLIMMFGVPTSVYAQSNRIVHADASEVETGALVSLEFADGSFASIDASWSLPVDNPTWGGLSLRVTGEQGEISADVFGGGLRGYSAQSARSTWRGYGPNVNRLMLAEFIDAIRESRPPSPDGRDGLVSLDVVLAAYESVRTGRPVGIPAP